MRTACGPVQFGLPPETIKDSMNLGIDVPTIYVIPSPTFDRHHGVSVSEMEFPTYYNYFILKRRIRILIQDEATETRFRAMFSQALFGPEGEPADEEFAEEFPHEARPCFATESVYFRKDHNGDRLEMDQVVEFLHFGDDGCVQLSNEVEIRSDGKDFVVFEKGCELARVAKAVELPKTEIIEVAETAFVAPKFGVTILGASHGFDPKGKTTGFILWVGRRGLLVDPPVNSTEILREQGVPPKLIDGTILTHCHADHDSGTFQKVLEEGQISLYTTPFIVKSFLTKYSNLTNIGEDLLRRTFTFQPVKIGAPVRVHGAEIYFFYTLHSIPTVGFEVFYGNKSMIFSGDTLYDPVRIKEMNELGYLSAGRRDRLLSFPWYHSVVLHEAGVPGIHTPVKVLSELSEETKGRLYLVHIAQKDMPKGLGLKNARTGFNNTICIEVEPPHHHESIEMLDIFCGVDLFRSFTLERAREILNAARRVKHPRGTRVITQGDPGDRFYILVSGVCAVVRDKKELKTYQTGDYFGETALVLNRARSADVVARTDVDLVEMDRYDFLYLLRGTDLIHRLSHLARMQEERSWQVIGLNSALRHLTSGQKTQLQSYLVPKTVAQDDILWKKRNKAREALLVDSASISLEGVDADFGLHFSTGAFVGEVDALRNGTKLTTTAKAVTAGRVFTIAREDLIIFFSENPGVLISFLGTRFVE